MENYISDRKITTLRVAMAYMEHMLSRRSETQELDLRPLFEANNVPVSQRSAIMLEALDIDKELVARYLTD